jgi:hypothetical protein
MRNGQTTRPRRNRMDLHFGERGHSMVEFVIVLPFLTLFFLFADDLWIGLEKHHQLVSFSRDLGITTQRECIQAKAPDLTACLSSNAELQRIDRWYQSGLPRTSFVITVISRDPVSGSFVQDAQLARRGASTQLRMSQIEQMVSSISEDYPTVAVVEVFMNFTDQYQLPEFYEVSLF